MNRRTAHRRLLWAATLGLAGGAIGLAGRGIPQDRPKADDVKIVFPPDRAVLLAGTFNVIVKGGQGSLSVDGQPQPWDAFAPPLRVTRIGVTPGLHEIRIGDRKVAFSVGLSEEEHDGPKDWPIYRFHGIPAFVRCSVCHETSQKDGLASVAGLKGAKACFACHKVAEFEARHSHTLKPLEHCQNCHALHGSARKSLLKAPVKKLCAACHDS